MENMESFASINVQSVADDVIKESVKEMLDSMVESIHQKLEAGADIKEVASREYWGMIYLAVSKVTNILTAAEVPMKQQAKRVLNECYCLLMAAASRIPREFEVDPVFWAGMKAATEATYLEATKQFLHKVQEYWIRWDGKRFVDEEDLASGFNTRNPCDF